MVLNDDNLSEDKYQKINVNVNVTSQEKCYAVRSLIPTPEDTMSHRKIICYVIR